MTTAVSRAYKTIIVEPANSRREAGWVGLAVMIIVLLMGVRVWLLPEETQSIFLQPYQRLDTDLNDTERSLYQAFLSSEQEIIRLWEQQNTWPTVSNLNDQMLPPFAVDLLPGALAGYTWTMHDRNQWVDYIGIGPENDPSMPTALLRIINLHADFHPHPHPGLDYDPNQKAAVQIWLHPESRQRYPGMQLAKRGWFWILAPDDPILKAPAKKGTSP